MIVVWWASAAWALEPMCAEPLTHDAWKAYMDKADAAFATSEMSKAHVALDSARELLPCLTEPPRPGHLARYAEQLATLAFFDQDETAAVRWGMVHRFVADDFPWPFPEGHPLRDLIDETEDPPMGSVPGLWMVPKNSSVFLNGFPITKPEARAEVPQLVQIFDKKGVVTRSYWQDGAAFAVDLVGPEGIAITAPLWFVQDKDYASAGGPPPAEPEVADVDDPVVEPPPVVVEPPPVVVEKPVVVEPPPVVVPKPPSGDRVVQAGVEVGFPTGVRVEVLPAEKLRVGVRIGGTIEPLNLADGLQGTVYGGAVGGMDVAGPVGVELTAGLAYTFGGQYKAWNEAFGVGHALPLVGVDATLALSEHLRLAGGVRAAFGSFVWMAPEGQLILVF